MDDTLAAQAVKCLVHLSKEMLEADRAAGLREPGLHQGLDPASRLEAAAGGHDAVLASTHEHQQNGSREVDSEADSEANSEEEQDRQQLGFSGAPGLTLPGLVRRMAKMAGDR